MRQQTPLFYNKYGFVIIKMARDIFNMEVGDRLSSIAEYAEVFSSGRGTVQEALKFLQENHSISL
ncbi:MAG: helix-turn-helix domain-containing protein, partial [Bacillota bacterium]